MQVSQTMAMITVALLLQMILCLMPFTAAAADSAVTRSCGDNSTTATSSTYQANLQLLSTALPKNASSSSLYARGSAGGSDAAYGLVLCRGDTANASACGGCVNAAFREALRLCGPASNNAHVVYETCAVHVSSRDFVYRADDVLGGLLFVSDPPLPGSDPADAERTNTIGGLIDVLLRETGKQAAYDSTTRYATGRMDVNSSGPLPAIYSIAQCVPDLRPVDCWSCLRTINGMASTYFAGREGGRADGVWCNFRYGARQFYRGEPMRRIDSSGAALLPSTNTTAPNQKHKGRMIKVVSIATTVPLLALLLGFFVCIGLIRRHRKGKSSSQEEELVWGIGGSSELMFFSFSQVSDATSNFSNENKLGQGGFGPVYKGRLADGSDVAIKRLASHSVQGFTEFQNEVQLIAKLQHTNLVRLMGCCSHGEEKILIYEYLPNKSLDFFIFDEARRLSLSWSKRLQIIEGIAQGILYLHKHSRLRVIHRDLKASNILLDQDMNPKISDFGLAKIFNSNDIEGNTKRIDGTYGYMAPEYASKGIFSFKSDVFSFGVLLLEIISGTRNSSFHQYGNFFDLLGYEWKLWNEERWLELVDASLVSEFHTSEMMRCVNIALICVEENAADRPTMSDVVAMLNNESITIPEPRHPAYLHLRVTREATPEVPGPSNINDMTISMICGR